MNENPTTPEVEFDTEEVQALLLDWGFLEEELPRVLQSPGHFLAVLEIRQRLQQLNHKTAEAQGRWFPVEDDYSGLRDGRTLRQAMLDGDARVVIALLKSFTSL